MKRARDGDEVARCTQGEAAAGRSLKVFQRPVQFPSPTALVKLLRKYHKLEQAESVMRSELLELDLWNCQIGDNGARIVAEFLKDDATIREVYLYECNIGPLGAKAIAEALRHNETVQRQNL